MQLNDYRLSNVGLILQQLLRGGRFKSPHVGDRLKGWVTVRLVTSWSSLMKLKEKGSTSLRALRMEKMGVRMWGFIFILFLGCLFTVSNCDNGPIVGGLQDVPNFQTNKEIQNLAKYAVKEYNKQQNAALSFSKVVKAQQQVVSGMKYYLQVETVDGGKSKLYNAVIYVKPWQNIKQLLSFAPA